MTVIRRLMAELSEMEQGSQIFQVHVDPESMTHWESAIPGPVGTSYEGHLYIVDLVFPAEYPFLPPKVTFRTSIFHPNVSLNGAICLDILKPGSGAWSPLMTVQSVLLSIQSLLTEPNPDDPLNVDAAGLYIQNRDAFDEKARSYPGQLVSFQSGRIMPRQEDGNFSHLQLSQFGNIIDEEEALNHILSISSGR